MARFTAKGWVLAILATSHFSVAIIIPPGFLSDSRAMLLTKRQDQGQGCDGPVICARIDNSCLYCDSGFYCVGSSGCCPIGQVCPGISDSQPCINAGSSAPSGTQVCPTDTPLCTTVDNVPVCTGNLLDWKAISANLDFSSNLPPPPPDTASNTPETSSSTSTPSESRPSTSSTETEGSNSSNTDARTTPPRTGEQTSSSTPPIDSSSSSSTPPPDSNSNPNNNSSNNSETLKIGLGVGLGLGIPLTLIIVGATIYLRRRRRHENLDTAPVPTVGGIQNMEYLAGSGIARPNRR